jgi:hypothetical protein
VLRELREPFSGHRAWAKTMLDLAVLDRNQ